jgi:hypothetical protein
MVPDDDRPEPKVKELLAGAPLEEVVDLATKAELERWFGLPSFTELAEKGVELPEDPEVAAIRERRIKAIAAVDPALLEWMRIRNEVNPESLITFSADIDVRVKLDMTLIDQTMAERGHMIAEPREVEISEALRDDMKDVAPQALLRDLHRPELEFDKTFEIVDVEAERRIDAVAEVAKAMATSWKLPPLEQLPFEQERRRLAEDREIRRRPWRELPMPNRRVSE